MTQNPKVYILILNYNNASDTIACVQSVARNCYDNDEIIVVDNASNDGSAQEILDWLVSSGQHFKHMKSVEIADAVAQTRITFIQNDSNAGFAGGNRVGVDYALAHSKEGFVLLLNNDTVVEPDFIQPLLDVYERHEDAGLVGGIINCFDTPERVWFSGGDMHWYREAVHRTDFDAGKEDEVSPFITGCLMTMPLSLVQKVGFMDERYFLYVEDCDYAKTVLENGYTNYVATKSVIYHKTGATTGGEGSPTPVYYGTRNRLFYHYKHFPKPDFMIFFILFVQIKLLRCLRFLLRGEKELCASTVKGIWDFFSMKKGGGALNG